MSASSQPTPASAGAANALLATARALGSQEDAGGAAPQTTARTALHCLAAFAGDQVRLFHSGFAPAGALAPDPQFPHEFLLEILVRQLSFDIDLLQRVLGQRAPGSTTPALANLLGTADRLAAAALTPAVAAGLIPPTAPLTYWQKAPTVRLLPYAPVAVIGFELAAGSDPLRLVAIGHEVGHQVYRQLCAQDTPDYDAEIEAMAAAAPRPSPAWLLAWAEEIFADVYGVLIAGPVAGLSLERMLTRARAAVLTVDDGDHPLPALRPDLVVTVLRQLSRSTTDERQRLWLENAANALAEHWQCHLAAASVPAHFTPAGAAGAVSLADARTLVNDYVTMLLEGELAPIAQDERIRRWSEGLATDGVAELPALEEQFVATLAALAKVTVPWLAAQGDHITVLPAPAGSAAGSRSLGATGSPALDALRGEALAGQRQLTPDEWKAVFLAGGWVTEQGGSGITPPVFARRKKPAKRPIRPLQPGQKIVAG